MRTLAILAMGLLLTACERESADVALGTLERDRIALTATVAEVLVDLPIPKGTRVEKGQVLARLDDRLQLAEVERGKSEVAQAGANLQKLENGPRTEDIAAVKAQVVGAEATLREAQINYDRNRQLFGSHSVSQADVDRTLALRDAAQASLDQARAKLDELEAGTRKEDLAQARARLAAAKAELDYRQTLLAQLTITATRDGVLDNLPWNLGERVTQGSPVAILLAGGAPYARVYVPEPYRVKVKAGDRLDVRVDGIAVPFEGRVRWISSEPAFTPYYGLSESDRSRLMYLAEVELPRSAADLPNGVPAQVQMP